MHILLTTILRTRQWRPWSCATAVFRLVVHALTDERFTEREAMNLLGTTWRGGTKNPALERELRDPHYGLKVTRFRQVNQTRINRELASGALVVCADDLGRRHGHVITLIEDLADGYRVVDPIWGVPRKRDKG